MVSIKTELIDNKGKNIRFYDVLINLKTNKEYIVMPIGRGYRNISIARRNIKTGKPSSNVRYPIDDMKSREFEIIGNAGFINE